MASSIEAGQRGASSRRGRPASETSARRPTQGLGWIYVALGTAAIVAGLGGWKKGTLPLALTAFAGVAAVAAVRNVQHGRGRAGSKGQGGASGGVLEVQHSITVGKTADELRQCWLDPRTLPQITAGFATVRSCGNGRMHWKIEGPLGHALEWHTEAVDDLPEGIGWRSLPNASISNEGSVRFRPAPADRGTVVTLHLRFDRPGGTLGSAAAKRLGITPLDLAVDDALRRFKSLIETGEIPTTKRQPAARANTR